MKNLSKILVLVLVLSLFTNVALAEVEVNENHLELVERLVERTNDSIEEAILRTQEIAERIIGLFGENEFSERIVTAMIDSLVRLTNAKANAVIRVGEQLGVKVVCYDIEVEIGGQTVLIDPLYVIAD